MVLHLPEAGLLGKLRKPLQCEMLNLPEFLPVTNQLGQSPLRRNIAPAFAAST